MNKAYIMMATFNGEAYVEEQIRTILAQNDVEVTLRICDDGSSDRTVDLVRAMAEADSRIIFSCNETNQGVGLNFMNMVREVSAAEYDYFGFSDQDDVWLPEKLSTAVRVIERTEALATTKQVEGFGRPVLYTSDLENFFEGAGLASRELAQLNIDLAKRATPLIRNYFSGCTMVFNSDFARLLQSFRVSEMPRIHDAWSAMVAFYAGTLTFDAESALLRRRNHGANLVGALAPGGDVRRASLKRVFQAPPQDMVRAASCLRDGYGEYFTSEDMRLVQDFLNYRASWRSRLRWAFSTRYQLGSQADTFLARVRFILGRY